MKIHVMALKLCLKRIVVVVVFVFVPASVNATVSLKGIKQFETKKESEPLLSVKLFQKAEIYSSEPKEAHWNENKVNEWMTANKISSKIRNNINPCSGEILFQLYSILKFNPEFFYGSLQRNEFSGWRDLKELAHFCLKLKELFENNK